MKTRYNFSSFEFCMGKGFRVRSLMSEFKSFHDRTFLRHSYLLTNWLAYLYGRIQSPRPNVMPDRKEGITRAAGFGFACIDTQAS